MCPGASRSGASRPRLPRAARAPAAVPAASRSLRGIPLRRAPARPPARRAPARPALPPPGLPPACDQPARRYAGGGPHAAWSGECTTGALRPARAPPAATTKARAQSAAPPRPPGVARIEPACPARESARLEAVRPGTEPIPSPGLERGLSEQPVGQRPHVETRPADHDRQPAGGAHGSQPTSRLARVAPCAVALAGLYEIEPEVRHPGQGHGIGLGGADVQPAIDLTCVGGNDRERFERRQGRRDGRLADAGGTHENGDEWAVRLAQTGARARLSGAGRWSAGRGRRAPAGWPSGGWPAAAASPRGRACAPP